jgi:hypothetical protein|tara:strand:+ start:477 stop:818 length:342 start_codon:yes stop_codon:yes gene_type:complete
MFNWIKSKISKKINSEMDGCILQNLNFVNMVEEEQYIFKRNIDQTIMNRIYEVKEQTKKYDKIKKAGDNFSPEETDDLLKMNMHCRNIWKNYFNKNAVEFDKVFSSDDLDSGH